MLDKKAILLILDGWGIAPPGNGNAITLANPKTFNHLVENYPYIPLDASGPAVGLPEGQDGNSETGHLNIGAGRVVYQDLALINMSIADGSFFTNKALLETAGHVKSFQSRLHLLGMIGSSGVHAFNEHLYALLLFAQRQGIQKVFLHLITDGRDSSPQNAIQQIELVKAQLAKYQTGSIASIMGRYYAMDRDMRMDRTQKAFDCLMGNNTPISESAEKLISECYSQNIYDEFIIPHQTGENPQESRVKPGDAVIFYNFRTDRPRQLTQLFLDSKIPNLRFVTMTHYRKDFDNPVMFPTTHVANTIGEIIDNHNFAQLRMAETEKIAMVTYYMNGQSEIPFPKERRVFVDSPKIATYDLKPEMSTKELVDGFIKEFSAMDYKLSIINFACPDMVAHTGKIPQTVKAIKAADDGIAKLVELAKKTNSYLLITADHGNAEELIDVQTHGVNTEHSTFQVPFIIFHDSDFHFRLAPGRLGDVAPTILYLLELPQPPDMTGANLVVR